MTALAWVRSRSGWASDRIGYRRASEFRHGQPGGCRVPGGLVPRLQLLQVLASVSCFLTLYVLTFHVFVHRGVEIQPRSFQRDQHPPPVDGVVSLVVTIFPDPILIFCESLSARLLAPSLPSAILLTNASPTLVPLSVNVHCRVRSALPTQTCSTHSSCECVLRNQGPPLLSHS